MIKTLLVTLSAMFLMVSHNAHARNHLGLWYKCPPANDRSVYVRAFQSGGVVRCQYRKKDRNKTLINTVTLRSKSGRRFRTCFKENRRYLYAYGHVVDRMFCSTLYDDRPVAVSAYAWASKDARYHGRQLYRERFKVVRIGYTHRKIRRLVACRVRFGKEYYFGYLLKRGKKPVCTFVYKNGHVTGRYHYDLLYLIKGYGYPGGLNEARRNRAFELINRRRHIPEHQRLRLCVTETGGKDRLPGVRIRGVCYSHWAGKAYVNPKERAGVLFGLR